MASNTPSPVGFTIINGHTFSLSPSSPEGFLVFFSSVCVCCRRLKLRRNLRSRMKVAMKMKRKRVLAKQLNKKRTKKRKKVCFRTQASTYSLQRKESKAPFPFFFLKEGYVEICFLTIAKFGKILLLPT